jgi:hypothetical protein
MLVLVACRLTVTPSKEVAASRAICARSVAITNE